MLDSIVAKVSYSLTHTADSSFLSFLFMSAEKDSSNMAGLFSYPATGPKTRLFSGPFTGPVMYPLTGWPI